MALKRVAVVIFVLLFGLPKVAAQTEKAANPPASTTPTAQTPSKPAESSPAAAPAVPDESGIEEDKPANDKASASGKRMLCRNEARRMRGLQRVDSLQLCMAQARVACVKEAIAKKMPASERGAFYKACMN